MARDRESTLDVNAAWGRVRLVEIVERLRSVNDFVGVASVVVEHAAVLFEVRCAVSLFSTTAMPAIVVDNDPDLTDIQRQRYVAGGLATDPLYRAVAETHAPIVS